VVAIEQMRSVSFQLRLMARLEGIDSAYHRD